MIWNLLLDGSSATATTGKDGTNWGSIIMIGVIVLALIGMFVWQTVSSKKKQKEAKELVDGIKIGDRVKTIGGICGFVAEICEKDNTFVLETGMEGKKCYVRFDKGAIYQTSPEGTTAPESDKKDEKTEASETEAVKEVVETTDAPAEAKEDVKTEEAATEVTEEVKEEKSAKKSKSKKK